MKKCLIAGICFALFACKNNKEEIVNDTCSTANLSYAVNIGPIISANGCLNCHNSTAMQGGFSLQTYDQVRTKASQNRAGNSVLYGAVAHLAGFSPMPRGGSQIGSCDITKIKAWIDNGMPQ
jgi:mono/diheme cytochrome c family protein